MPNSIEVVQEVPEPQLTLLQKEFNEWKRRRVAGSGWSTVEVDAGMKQLVSANLRHCTELDIHNRVTNKQTHHTHRYPRFRWSNHYRYKDYRNQWRDMGERLREAVANDCAGDALDALNGYSRVRGNSNTNWIDWMYDKFNMECSWCDDCGRIEDNDDMHDAHNGDRTICQACIDDNYRWSDEHDTYIHCDSWDDYHEEEDEGIIGEYHSSKRKVGHIPSVYDKLIKPPVLLGMELEMEVSSDYARNDKAETINDAIGGLAVDGKWYKYCAFEHDGSLDYGFEMVTGYTGLDIHAKQLQFFKTPMRGVKSHDTRTCGLHVHVDKAGMNLFHAAKLVLFIHGDGNQRMIRAVARRGNANYAKIQNKKASYDWLKRAKNDRQGLRYMNDDRYEAINFQNDKTIEFRLFKGTLKYETIMSCLEFAYISWFFSRDMGINDLTQDNFLAYICKPENRRHTKFLREYLRQKNFILPKDGVVKPNPRVVEEQLVTEEV